MTMDEFCNICSTKCTELCRCHWFFFFHLYYHATVYNAFMTKSILNNVQECEALGVCLFYHKQMLKWFIIHWQIKIFWHCLFDLLLSNPGLWTGITLCHCADVTIVNLSYCILVYCHMYHCHTETCGHLSFFSNAVYSHVNTKMNIVDEYTVTVKKTVTASSNILTHNSIMSGQWWCT